MVKSAMRTPFGQVVGEVQKYAKLGGIGQSLMQEFLGQLGPVGMLIKGMMGTGKKKSVSGVSKDLRAAQQLLEAFGAKVEWPVGRRVEEITTEGLGRRVEDAQRLLESLGYRVDVPADERRKEREKREREEKRTGRRLPFDVSPTTKAGKPRKTIDMPGPAGKTRFKVTHPAVTGEWVKTPQSSNVYAVRYQAEEAELFVRFYKPAPKGQPRTRPGPIYKYSEITPRMARSVFQAADGGSPGSWVWDFLRVRGSVSQHQKPYKLVGIVGGYVPRHARSIGDEEWYMPRDFYAPKQKKWYRSRLGKEMVINRGEPNRGEPNRGEPNTGAPQ
jgi:hypothetical protein